MGAFADLLASPGVEELVEVRSRFGFLAFHGGSLEEGTDRVAADAAGRAGASLYAVIQPPDLRWHVPSAVVGADASPGLRRFLAHVEVAVALHGYGRRDLRACLLLGGRHRALAAHLAAHLRAALPGYGVVDDLDAIPAELRGQHPDNPVNLARGGGVQVELPLRARRGTDADALAGALAAAARSWAG
jgi:phage replication-related protein YjqB (UPF0714/DUF867 family)